MKQMWKQIGSLLLSLCMVVAMLPTVAFAEEDIQAPGISSHTSEIIAFADLAKEVALQKVEIGTTLEALNLPNTLAVTVSDGEVTTGNETQENEARKETAIEVSNWVADSDYDGGTAGTYIFTPTLVVPEGIILVDGITAPQIMIKVEASATPMLLGSEMQLMDSTDITEKFIDANFLKAVQTALGKEANDPIYDADVSSITNLDVSHKSIKSLAGIEYFTGLTNLYCGTNQLTQLDVSKNTELKLLDCSFNKLTTLDVSNNTALVTLSCKSNYMTDESSVMGVDTSTIYLSYEPQRETFGITVNNGTTILSKEASGEIITITANTPEEGKLFGEWKVVSGGVTIADITSPTTTFTMPSRQVEVTAIYDTDITDKFTDANFLAAVRKVLHKEADDSISDTDVSSITFLNIPSRNITNLEGIEYFTELTRLDCFYNNLTAIDISNNTKLTNLSCEYNQLTDLNLSNNTALAYLCCNNNQLTTLDVSNNSALTHLICNGNQLTDLSVSTNIALTELTCYNNQLTALDVNNNTALKTLNCSVNHLSELKLNGSKALTRLYCQSNPLTNLDVSSNTKLTNLECNNNHLSELDLGSNIELTSLICASNHLTTLDVSNNTKLTSLNCTYNDMKDESSVTGLDNNLTKYFTFVPQNTVDLESVDITNEFIDPNFLAYVRKLLGYSSDDLIYNTDLLGITSLNMGYWGIASLTGIEYFKSLKVLYCHANQLTVLDISKNTELTSLSCYANQLTALDVSKNTALTRLSCYDNQLTAIDVSKNTALTSLICSGNQLTALDVSKNTALSSLYCDSNQLTSIDVSKNTALDALRCSSNLLTSLDVSNNKKLNQMDCYDNYMIDESAVFGLDLNITRHLKFDPQNTGTSAYTITINNGTANPSKAAEGTIVTISANTPEEGKQFKAWTVVSGEITLANNLTAITTFTMPSNAVEVTATYEEIPVSVSVSSAAELKTALAETNSQIINVTADIEFTEEIKQGADHTLVIPSDKTVTASGTMGYIRIGSHTLIMNGGGTFVCNRNGNALFSTDGTLNLENIIINITGTGGIWVKTVNINSGTTVNLDATNGNNLILLDKGYTLNLNTGGAILITNFRSIAIGVDDGTLHFNGGSLTFGKEQDDNQTCIWIAKDGLLKYSSGMLNATDGAVISLNYASSVEGVSGGLIDGGYTLSTDGKITISDEDVTPAEDTLTAGYYHWNSTKNAFEKQRITIQEQPKDVTVTEGSINGSLSVTASASNGKTISYQWLDKDKNVISGADDAIYTLPMDLTAGTYKYYCFMIAPDCMGVDTRTVTRAVTVTVKPVGGTPTYTGTVNNGTASSTNTTTAPEKKPNQSVTAVAPVVANASKNGVASASIPDRSISDAIAKAQADAKAQGKTTNGVSVALNVTMPEGTTALTTTLTRSSLNSLVSAGITNLEINGSPITVAFDQKSLTQIQKKSNGNINIIIAPKTSLSEIAKKIIGSRPVYNITIGYGDNHTVSNFGDGVATISIPYTPADGEAIGGVYAVYVDEKGNATRITGSTYDANSGCVIFTTPHFSMYGIGYTAPSAQFTDIGNHWAKESIDYVVGRGLLSGTTETTFAPTTAMTREMLVAALGRLEGVDTKMYTTSSFTDVNVDSTECPYIEWAYKQGIIHGIGSHQFAPDRAITREEIAVIIANFAKACDYTLPNIHEAITYADASSIGSAYKTAVTAMQQAGIMTGGTSNKFNPKSNATRAEVSCMLNHYIKLTIDPNTAKGWTLNDAGQYLYYKDGKVLIGTQTIDGVKYVFNSNGILQTGWVKDGDKWRFYSGKTMLIDWWNLGENGNELTYYFAKDGLMVSGKWLEIESKWYYFNTDGSLARSTKIDGYEVDENGVRKTK